MTTIDLKIDLGDNNIVLDNNDKEKLSFIVTRVFSEYKEEQADNKLIDEIKESSELDDLISNIKF